jgi:DinB family protein
LRRDNLRLIERATPADLERVGVHAERGEESAGYLVRLYAGHDLMHLAQIERIARAVGDRVT